MLHFFSFWETRKYKLPYMLAGFSKRFFYFASTFLWTNLDLFVFTGRQEALMCFLFLSFSFVFLVSLYAYPNSPKLYWFLAGKMWIKTRSQSRNRMSLFWRRPVIWSEIFRSILMWLWVLQEKLMVDIGLICSMPQEDQQSTCFNSPFFICFSCEQLQSMSERCWRYI